jgi:hypothetical protein
MLAYQDSSSTFYLFLVQVPAMIFKIAMRPTRIPANATSFFGRPFMLNRIPAFRFFTGF